MMADVSYIDQLFVCEGFAAGLRTSWVRTLIDWTKKGRISLISIEHRLGSC